MQDNWNFCHTNYLSSQLQTWWNHGVPKSHLPRSKQAAERSAVFVTVLHGALNNALMRAMPHWLRTTATLRSKCTSSQSGKCTIGSGPQRIPKSQELPFGGAHRSMHRQLVSMKHHWLCLSALLMQNTHTCTENRTWHQMTVYKFFVCSCDRLHGWDRPSVRHRVGETRGSFGFGEQKPGKTDSSRLIPE